MAVLRLAAEGYTVREMALRLAISPATVSGHLAQARYKMGAVSTTQAVARAIWAGLLEECCG